MPGMGDAEKRDASLMTAREIQSEHDRAEIKVRLIENGILVKTGIGWFSFANWELASDHIAARIASLKSKRNEHKPSQA